MRNGSFTSIVLCLGLLAPLSGCDKNKPDGAAQPPGGDGAVAATTDGASDGSGDDSGGASDDGSGSGDGGAAPAAKACDAKVADTPTALFGDKVLIRPPLNVELVEENPTMAQTYASGGFVSACDATVDKMYLLVFPNDKKKDAATYMVETIDGALVAAGFAEGTRGKNFVETATQVDTSVEYPAGEGAPPAKLYVSVKKLYDNTLVTVFVTRPAEFDTLAPTFQESAASLIVLPPDA
ncbi:MAG: hypothetical protein KUG77_13205 [Nannocystaceae bacterium]|nr:hypothetical protein [Nannocystaceae bacterium]